VTLRVLATPTCDDGPSQHSALYDWTFCGFGRYFLEPSIAMNTYVLFPGSQEEFEALIDVVGSLYQQQIYLDTGIASGRFQIIEQSR